MNHETFEEKRKALLQEEKAKNGLAIIGILFATVVLAILIVLWIL